MEMNLAQLVALNSMQAFTEAMERREQIFNKNGLSIYPYEFKSFKSDYLKDQVEQLTEIAEMLNEHFSYEACEFLDEHPDALVDLLKKIEANNVLPLCIIGLAFSKGCRGWKEKIDNNANK